MAAYCLKINHLPQGDKKIKHEVFISFGNVVPANTSALQQPCISTCLY